MLLISVTRCIQTVHMVLTVFLCDSTEPPGPTKVVKAGNPPKAKRGGKVMKYSLSSEMRNKHQKQLKEKKKSFFFHLF